MLSERDIKLFGRDIMLSEQDIKLFGRDIELSEQVNYVVRTRYCCPNEILSCSTRY